MGVFVAVADQQGFAAAARRLGISTSAATRMVAALEDKLGTRLFQRTTRSVTLTSAGERYLERTRRILADVSEAEGAAQQERTKPTGRFVVAAPLMFGRLHVAPAMCHYLSKYPAVIGELTLGDRMVNLVDEGIDAAIRIGVLEDSSLVARPVGATRRVVVASPAYLAKRKKLRVPEDVVGHQLIQFTGINPLPQWRFGDSAANRRVAFQPAYITNSADAAIGHALLGGGITMVLAYQVAEAVRVGKLKIILEDFELPPLPIHIVFPSTRLLSAKVRAFVDLVVRTCDWQFVEL
ncbi:MAG: hypothetical protein RJA70_3123 [Pseudomonadota bacterium]